MLGQSGRWKSSVNKTLASTNKDAGEARRECIRFHSRKGSPSVGDYIELPSCLSQRILDLGEVANTHHLENEPVDVGFEFSQCQGAGIFLPRGFPATGAVNSFRGLPRFLPVGIAFPSAAALVFPLRLPVRPNDALVL